MSKYENEYVSMWIEDGILFTNYRESLEIDLVTAEKIVRDRLKFTDNESYPILIDFSNMKSATKDARDYMNSQEGGLKGLKCGAFLGNNSVAVLFINLYLKINKPSIPAKFFTNKQDAINWLKSINKSL